jgi:hypothetical protein
MGGHSPRAASRDGGGSTNTGREQRRGREEVTREREWEGVTGRPRRTRGSTNRGREGVTGTESQEQREGGSSAAGGSRNAGVIRRES